MTVIGSYQVWPEGLTWVFQGTIAETADAGTHVCTLTVTPGVGNEMQFLQGSIKLGNSATAQGVQVFVDDGANKLYYVLGSGGGTTTTANLVLSFPTTSIATTVEPASPYPTQGYLISGAMRLILQVSTAAVSITQTFAVVCRIKGSAPTAVLNDTVGIFTPTTNTSKVFG